MTFLDDDGSVDVMDEPITFLASLPPIMSAIRVGGDGARVQFEIPENEMPSIVRLMLCKGKVLRVTVELEDEPLGPVARRK